jgi:hypothetical protein
MADIRSFFGGAGPKKVTLREVEQDVLEDYACILINIVGCPILIYLLGQENQCIEYKLYLIARHLFEQLHIL